MIGGLAGFGMLVYHLAWRKGGNGKTASLCREMGEVKTEQAAHDERLRQVEVWQGGANQRLSGIEKGLEAVGKKIDRLLE